MGRTLSLHGGVARLRDALLALLLLGAGCGERPCPDVAACRALAEAREAAGDVAGGMAARERACRELGDAAQCAEAAQRFLEGRGPVEEGGQPFGRGLALLEVACGGGNAPSCVTLAKRHLKGLGVPKDEAAALRWFASACAAGDGESCVDEGLLRETGRGAPKDEAAAEARFRQACEAGVGRGCVKVGLRLRAAGRGPEGVALVEEGCRKGFYAGCGLAALAWEKGDGVPPDPRRRVEMLAAGAALGDPRAIEALVAVDGSGEALAAMDGTLDARCRGGDGGACLARASLAEIGGQRDIARIAGLLHDACVRGAPAACGRLAELAEEGLAAVPDEGLVVSHERACEADRAPSCEWLGAAYEAGELTELPDLRRAREVWDRACRLGRPQACDAVRRLDLPLP